MLFPGLFLRGCVFARPRAGNSARARVCVCMYVCVYVCVEEKVALSAETYGFNEDNAVSRAPQKPSRTRAVHRNVSALDLLFYACVVIFAFLGFIVRTPLLQQ